MSRFLGGAVVVSKPIHTVPNGDYFFIEMRKKNGQYECSMKIGRSSDLPVQVVRVQARTVREAQERCYQRAVEKFRRLPRPPYFKRGHDIVRVPSTSH